MKEKEGEMSVKSQEPIVLNNTTELFDLFHFVQKIDVDDSFQEIADIGYPEDGKLDLNSDMCFYRVKELSYDEEYPRREAFENVINALDNEAFNFVYILSGNKLGVELDIGVVKNHRKNRKTLSTVNYGQIIESAFEGNFNGSYLEKMKTNELSEKIISRTRDYKHAGIISGIPSVNENESGDDFDFQGIDRLINSMMGQDWRVVVICEPVSQAEILNLKDDIYELYNRLSVYSKISVQKSINSGNNVSFGRNVSDSKGKNRNWSESDTETKGIANSSGTKNSNNSHLLGKGGGDNEDHSEGKNWSYSKNRGISEAVTLEMANKHAQELMQYIDDELLPRIKKGYAKGMYKTSMYYMSDKVTTANRLKLSIMSLFQGNKSTFSPLLAQEVDISESLVKKALTSFQNSYCKLKEYSLDVATLLGKPVDAKFGLGISSYLTAGEVGILAGLPQKEVPGIILKESVDFGLNEHALTPENTIDLGVLVQKGRKLDIRFALRKDSMMKHTFIAGVTGMGKTTTCHKLLAAADMPFLVIEPAKTEYRTLVKNSNKFGSVYVFTLGNESIAPFRINPFELVKGEVISAHIDMLKATFTSAFPMEASMPQILEEAIVRCYENKGWNLDTNTNRYYDPFDLKRDKSLSMEEYLKKLDAIKEKSFPIMSDLLEQMKLIVKEKGFSPQMQADYEGSLVSRLSNLTVGAKGRMLNCPYSTDFRFIAYNKVIIEMEELKSPEDKALFMGFILSRLSAVIKNEHKKHSDFRHLTLIEEAHRLLSKVDYGDSGSKKAAVETFTDLLAEVRKYGEGLIIVDQIPNKLAPEVLKNTNTKIIHKILARDDKEAVGDTMLMDDKQKEYLSALEPGQAIIFSEDTDKPVHVYVERMTDTNEDEIEDDVIKQLFNRNREEFGSIYEELEILPYYDTYIEIAEMLRRRNIDVESFDKMKNIVKRISEISGMSIQEIFRRFYARRERLVGNSIDNELAEDMSRFLAELFTKEKIEYSDLKLSKCRLFI